MRNKIVIFIISCVQILFLLSCSSNNIQESEGKYGLTRNQIEYVQKESNPGGELDFEKQLGNQKLFLIGNVAYNRRDTALFLWGQAIRKFGISSADNAVSLYEEIKKVNLEKPQINAIKNGFKFEETSNEDKAKKPEYAKKNYDLAIFEYQMKLIKDNQISKESYLTNSKPFSKWDPRPLKDSMIYIMDEWEKASTVPNFFWGSISNYYGESIEDAMELPKIFSRSALDTEQKYIKHFQENQKQFEILTENLSKSTKSIFLNQNELKRVDGLFKEGEHYWKYIIAEDSPFPISDSIDSIGADKYSDDELAILNIMKKLDIYAIFNSKDAIFFLVDGLLDNSYGFVYKEENERIKTNHLFKIEYLKNIKSNYSYYISY